MGKTRKVLLLAGLVGIGSVVLKNLRDEAAPAPAAPRPAAPRPTPVPEAPVPEAPVLEAPVPDVSAGPQVVAEESPESDTPIGDSAESMVDTSSFAPITDVSPDVPVESTVAESAPGDGPETDPETGPPADSLTSFFDEVLTESKETKRGRRR